MTTGPDILSAPHPRPRRLSDVLRDLEAGLGPRVALGDLVSGLRDRSFAPLLVLFAVPNVFLYLPGSSVITGLPLMIIALQLIAGRPSVWLPRALNDRSIDRASFADMGGDKVVIRLDAQFSDWVALALIFHHFPGLRGRICPQ